MMEKITKKDFSKKLAKYGALSLAIAGVADATGQVNYTDVDPDFEGVGDGVEYFVDLNNDGTDEIRFVIGTFGGNLFSAMDNNGDALSGLTVGQMVGNYTYALNLSSGSMISAGTGDFGGTGSLCYLDGIAGTFCGDGGSTPNGYAGVSFVLDGNTHYGWIELLNVTAGTLNVSGYAFEATPDTAIAAGDQGELNTPEQNLLSFKHFVDSNNNLAISNKVEMNDITIFDISGKQVMTQSINQTDARINLASLNTGVYIAKVTIEGAEKSFKFVR